MSAVVSIKDNSARTLDRKAEPEETIEATDIEDSSKLARLLTRMLRDLTVLRRRFAPRRTLFRDIVTTGDNVIPSRHLLPHRFGSAVEWSVVGRKYPYTGSLPLEVERVESDANTLAIDVYYVGTISIAVQEVG